MSISHALEAAPLPPEPSIKEYLEVLRRRRTTFFQVFVAVAVLGVVVAAMGLPVYQTHAKLLVPPASATFSLVDSNNPIGAMLAAAQPDSLGTQLQVLQSAPFLAEAKRQAKVVPRPRIVPPAVQVETLSDSNVIRIAVEGGDPEEVARLANIIVDLHLERTDLAETTGIKGTIDFVRKEREKAAGELARAERRLLAFRRDHRIVQLSADQEASAKEYVALQTKMRETGSNVTSTHAQIAELRAQLAREPLDLIEETVKENPRRAKLEEKRDELMVQRAELLQDFLPTSQRVRTLDERIARAAELAEAEPETIRVRTHRPNTARTTLQARLAELEAELRGLIAAQNAARAEFEANRQIVDNLGPWEVQQARLTQERNAAQTAANTFSDRLRDLEIRARARLQTARVIERAGVPTSPIRPRKAMNVALSCILAIFVAGGVVFLQEHLDDRVNSPEDIERIGPLATLGHVPLIAAGQPRLVSGLPVRSHVAEAYRALRSSIGFAAADTPVRRLTVTSAAQGEGKTTTAVNLAIAMAHDGKRVVLVDADLRRPSIHRLLNLPPGPGLSELLVGMQSVEAVLRETEVENLRAIPAGAIPPNPAELLGAHAFRALLKDLDDVADVVIFDTPPCIPVTDPLIVAARTDGVLVVVHAGETRKEGLKQAMELLERAHARTLGVVINRVQPHRGGPHYYHYYYYYGGYYRDDGRSGKPHHRNGHERQLSPREGAAAVVTRPAVEEDDRGSA